MMNKAYLILGGNKGDKLQNLEQALQLIDQKAGGIEIKSDVFETAAWGNTNQPNFVNQVIRVQTILNPFDLLKTLLSIEEQLGRVRTNEKWMERTIDIDILFYDDEIIKTTDLTIPHPFIQDRKFVLLPLAQIAPELIHPILQKNIIKLLEKCSDTLDVKPFISNPA
jgi:2-amino-4-hydroxy-6-hydroxymethyldihydropteridine diphosphokinase